MIYKQNKTNTPLCDALSVRPGITAVIGGGGKTTLLRTLAAELSRSPAGDPRSTVILCTSTHIYPFQEYPCIEALPDGNCLIKMPRNDPEDPAPGPVSFPAPGGKKNAGKNVSASITRLIREALSYSPVLCIGTPEESSGKYTAPPLSFLELSELAEYVLVEADGSKGRPFKAHASYEPVIPEGTARTILVAGACAFMRPIAEAVHRPEIFLRKLNSFSAYSYRHCHTTDDFPEMTARPSDPDISKPQRLKDDLISTGSPCVSDIFKNACILTPESLVTPELAAAFINLEGLADICLLTQTDLFCQNDTVSPLPPQAKLRAQSLSPGNASLEDLLERFREALLIPLVTASV